MKRLVTVATLSALLAVGAYASTTAFAANAHGTPPAAIVSDPVTPPQSPTAPEPPETSETPGTESATEPAETGATAEPAELPGDSGHADDPADQNADHQFDGDE